MNQDKVDKLINLLEDISLAEWKKLKECVDREFNSQVNSSKFIKRDSFKKILEIDLTQ